MAKFVKFFLIEHKYLRVGNKGSSFGKLHDVRLPSCISVLQKSLRAIFRLENFDGVRCSSTAGSVIRGFNLIIKISGSSNVSSFQVSGLPS